MAGTITDFKIYDREFFGGMNEVLQQDTNVFNEASRGALRLVTRDIRGEFERESFMQRISNNISHRDPSSTSAVSSNKMEQDEMIGPKINRRIGPNEMTIDSFKKIGQSPEVFSFFYGQQTAEDVLADYVNTGLLAVRTAIENIGDDAVFDVTKKADSQLRTEYLLGGLRKFGDRANRIVAWVMHSAPFYDLVENQTLEKVTNVSDVVIFGGAPGTYNRPVIVTDSEALLDDTDENNIEYFVLGLTADAVEVAQSEDDAIWSDPQTGRENLAILIQGEYAFNVRAKGCAYSGTANPTDAALGNTENWDFVMHDVKLAPGVMIKVSEETVTT